MQIHKWSTKFVSEYRVPHSLLRNYVSLFIKLISLNKHINFLAILYPTSLANLVADVGTKHWHQILLDPWEQTSMEFESKYKTFNLRNAFENVVCEMAAILSRGDELNIHCWN